MQNILRNSTVKIWTKLGNPFKRYHFSKFWLNVMKSLLHPHELATVWCHGFTTLHCFFYTQIYRNAFRKKNTKYMYLLIKYVWVDIGLHTFWHGLDQQLYLSPRKMKICENLFTKPMKSGAAMTSYGCQHMRGE